MRRHLTTSLRVWSGRASAGLVRPQPTAGLARHFTVAAARYRHRHREFEADGPFQQDVDEYDEDNFLDGETQIKENTEDGVELSPEELEAEIPYDDYVYSDVAKRKRKEALEAEKNSQGGKTKGGRNARKYSEVENNMIYYEGGGSANSMERLKDLSPNDLQYIGPDGSLILEKLASSGMRDEPIIPLRDMPYEVPYSVEGYRNRQRVFEGFDPDAANPTSQFTDIKIVKLESGRGGSGKVSFFRDAGRAKGPPDGGDGGDGGSVYIQAVEGETSLHKIRYHYKAEDGKGGSMSQLNGRSGKDLLLQVPVGTTVRWIPDPKETYEHWKTHQIEKQYEAQEEEEIEFDSDKGVWRDNKLFVKVPVVQEKYDPVPLGIKLEREVFKDGEGWLFKDKGEAYHFEREYFLALRERVARFDRGTRAQEEAEDYFPLEGVDLSRASPPVLLLRGGKGGLGNMHFLTQTIRNPRFAKKGRGGAGSFFLLELKLLADLGLVGLPNAGKSTLLRAISKARPRVGHWEFTTLRPTIGTIPMGISQPSFTVADIPGIVRGARAENRGMGLDFLRHVERSGALVFVISLEPKEKAGESCVADLELLVEEVGAKLMADKRVLVVGTKADMAGSEAEFGALHEYCAARGWRTVACSGQRRENVERVIQAMASVSGKKY